MRLGGPRLLFGQTPTVVDLGSAVTRVAAWDRVAGACRVLAVPRKDPDGAYTGDEAGTLARAMLRRDIRLGPAVVVAPKGVVQVLPIELPRAGSGAPIEEIAACRAADMLGTAREEFEFVVTSSPCEEGTRLHSSVAVSRHADTLPIIEGLDAAGIEVAALVPPAAALASAARRCVFGDGGARPRLVLDVGWHDVTAVGLLGTEMVFERHLSKIGFRRVADALAESCGEGAVARWVAGPGRRSSVELAARAAVSIRPFGTELLRETEATLVYLEQLTDPERAAEVLIAGGGAEDPELLDWLGANLWVPVRRLRDAFGEGVRVQPGFESASGFALPARAAAQPGALGAEAGRAVPSHAEPVSADAAGVGS